MLSEATPRPEMTRAEVAALLKNWREDPCWDLDSAGDNPVRSAALATYAAQAGRLGQGRHVLATLRSRIGMGEAAVTGLGRADLELLAALAEAGLDAEEDALDDRSSEVLRLYPDDDGEPTGRAR